MTCKWCPVYVSSANGLNRVHKSGGLNFTGLHRLRFLPCRWQARSVWAAEKTWTLPFLPRATDASLLLAGKTRWAVVAGEKIERYLFSHAATDASLLLAGKTRWAVVAGEKIERYLFSHAATDASLLLAGKTRWAVVAVEKVKRYLFSHAEPFHPCAGTREAVEPR